MPRKVSKKKATGVGAGAGADRKAAASAAAAAEEEEEDRGAQDPDAHPYALGSWLVVRWLPDASDRLCTVIERAKVEDPEQMAPDTGSAEAARDGGGDDDACWRYYVHYADFNRRMDEWVKPDRVSRTPTAAAASAAAEGRVAPSTAAAEECAAPATTVAPPAAAAAAASPEAPLETSPEAPRVFAGGSGALAFGAARKRRKADSAADALTSVEDMEHDEHEGLDEASLREHEEVTKVKNVGRVELGRFTVETWYFSPYPKEYYPGGYVDELFIDELTFGFYRSRRELFRARARTRGPRAPPGDEIYRSGDLAMFAVDGDADTRYCQHLCYFAKLFLDLKTLYYDVDPFLFYVLCEIDDRGYHPVGYYSKEKYSEVGYNLACILAFPPYQRKGYGRFLIAFSYALSRRESKVGAPEKPLSDLGHIAYRSYWAATLIARLRTLPSAARSASVMELSKATSIMADDVAYTLQYLGLLRRLNRADDAAALWCPDDALDALARKHPVKPPLVDDAALHWTPFLADVKRDKFSIRAKKPPADETPR